MVVESDMMMGWIRRWILNRKFQAASKVLIESREIHGSMGETFVKPFCLVNY